VKAPDVRGQAAARLMFPVLPHLGSPATALVGITTRASVVALVAETAYLMATGVPARTVELGDTVAGAALGLITPSTEIAGVCTDVWKYLARMVTWVFHGPTVVVLGTKYNQMLVSVLRQKLANAATSQRRSPEPSSGHSTAES